MKYSCFNWTKPLHIFFIVGVMCSDDTISIPKKYPSFMMFSALNVQTGKANDKIRYLKPL